MQGRDILDISKLKLELSEFAKNRNWNEFHTPKNLVMAASVEMAELVEIFQWLNNQQSYFSNDKPVIIAGNSFKLTDVANEIADVILYLIRLSDILDINISCAIKNKINLNAQKYPASPKS